MSPYHTSLFTPVQAQAGSTELGKELAEVESLLQKQDLLEAQISAHGETIGSISSTALKVLWTQGPNTSMLLWSLR